MPTITNIFSSAERLKDFQGPPKFSPIERQSYFELPIDARKYLSSLRTTENKVNFIIQFGYFGAKGRFIEANKFREIDIKYIHRVYGYPASEVPKSTDLYEIQYGGPNSNRHRNKIIELKGWTKPTNVEIEKLNQYANRQSEQQTSPEDLLWALFAYCWNKQWVIPSYDLLSSIIIKSQELFETRSLDKIKNQLSTKNKDFMMKLLEVDQHSTLLTKSKKIDQSTKTQSMNKNAEFLRTYKDQFLQNESLINDLELSDSATQYYAHWVMKAKAFQLNQFRDRNKSYLYLLAFIQHQFFHRQDAAIKGFLSVLKRNINIANKKAVEFERKNNEAKNKAIDAVSKSQKLQTQQIKDLIEVVDDTTLTDKRKIDIIRNKLFALIDYQDEDFLNKVDFLDKYREKESKNTIFLDALINQSRSLGLAVDKLLQSIVFDEKNANPRMLTAIHYYQLRSSKISDDAPTGFLTNKERDVILDGDSINAPLYKMMFYRHLASQIKSGELSLKYSFEFRSLDDYMISREDWIQLTNSLLEESGLSRYGNSKTHLNLLCDRLENAYKKVNDNYANGDNPWLKIRPTTGRPYVKTPAIDYDQSKFISTLLANEGEIPIMQILRETDRVCHFTDLFKHHANRNVVKAILPEVGIAGIMGLGCNIGTRKMANRSIGIDNGVLIDAVNWRFSVDSLTKINRRIVAEIESLKLPNIFKVDENYLLSSSDGKKSQWLLIL